MAVGLRVIVFAFAIDELGPEDWLLAAVRSHANHLMLDQNYDRRGNHGLHQDLGLLVAGHLLNETDWLNLASRRIVEMFEEAIDREGVCREGCIDYQYRNFRWYHEALIRLQAVGDDDFDGFAERLKLMPEFLAHATNPRGEYVMLGDTLFHRAPRIEGTAADWVKDRRLAPSETTRIYEAGYLFSRAAWTTSAEDPDTSYLTQRFGPGRSNAVHGHEDGGSITLDYGEETLLRDSGLYAYEGGDARLYMRGRSAHNVIDVPGRRFYPSAPSDLLAFEEGDGYVFTTVRTSALQGVVWHRTMCWLPNAHALMVDDRVRLDSEDQVVQRWHLPVGSTVNVTGGAIRVVSPRGNCLSFQSVGHNGGVGIVEGSTAPFDGWVSLRYRELIPAPVLDLRLVSHSARFSSVILYGEDGTVSIPASLERDSDEFRCTLVREGVGKTVKLRSTGVIISEE
jgi:hypothetical protein